MAHGPFDFAFGMFGCGFSKRLEVLKEQLPSRDRISVPVLGAFVATVNTWQKGQNFGVCFC